MPIKPTALRERAAAAVRRDELHILMRMHAKDIDPQPRAFMRACENLWLEGYRAGLRSGHAAPEAECCYCDGKGVRMTHPAGARESCFACCPATDNPAGNSPT